MSEAGYVERPILRWLCGAEEETARVREGAGDTGLGWKYRDEAAMAAFDRPLEDPFVEKLLVEAIVRINDDVTTEAQARLLKLPALFTIITLNSSWSASKAMANSEKRSLRQRQAEFTDIFQIRGSG